MKKKIKSLLRFLNYDLTFWNRKICYEDITMFFSKNKIENWDVVEISGSHIFKEYKFKSYNQLNYPSFDICKMYTRKKYDALIADQVFEHVAFPYAAGKNVFKMLKKNGYLIITVPFLVKVHNVPIDCTRWIQTGLKNFLIECGFKKSNVMVKAWGNHSCVIKNFTSFKRIGWGKDLSNQVEFPCTVWAYAKK